ncbi:uncharacterized protein V1518DRAFT_410213 [Limtongia smithiae]|uniref:uncharacterized protein n=1 Tax=Limtongia smithiae TaxID=1125753 RepID=UPI0034CFD92A
MRIPVRKFHCRANWQANVRPRLSECIITQSRSLSVTAARDVLPSQRFTDHLGKQFYPQLGHRNLEQDVTKLCRSPEADRSELEKMFGDGRKLIAYLRILERARLEDGSHKRQLTESDVVAGTELYKSIYQAAIKLRNQLALARSCVLDVMDKDMARQTRGRKLLLRLRDTNLPAAYYICGNMHASAKQYDKAIEQFMNCIRAAKSHVEAKPKDDQAYYDYDREVDYSYMIRSHFMIGVAGEHMEDILLARKHYIEAIDLREISGESLPQLEIMAYNFLSVLAEWEHNPLAMEYFGLKSAQAGNVYGLLSVMRVGRRYDEDPKWSQKWQEVFRIQSLIDSNMHVTIQSPKFEPVFITKNTSEQQKNMLSTPISMS